MVLWKHHVLVEHFIPKLLLLLICGCNGLHCLWRLSAQFYNLAAGIFSHLAKRPYHQNHQGLCWPRFLIPSSSLCFSCQYPVSFDWSAHKCLTQHCLQPQSSGAKSILTLKKNKNQTWHLLWCHEITESNVGQLMSSFFWGRDELLLPT